MKSELLQSKSTLMKKTIAGNLFLIFLYYLLLQVIILL